MSNFALDVNSPPGDVISSLNYVLANLGTSTIDANVIIDIVGNVISNANVVTTNSSTGQLKSITQGTISYLYNYVNVKYANNNTGSIGFGSNSSGKAYYGVHNTTDGTISNNPADYNWYQVSGGFGTTKGLYYTPSGGGTVYFAVATTAPSTRYLPVPDNTAIYLQNLANSVVQTNNINPGAVTNVSIAANTITADNVKPNTLTALQIADRTLSQAQIALNSITGNTITQSTLTGNLIALNTITGNLVAQSTITGNLIVPGTITGNLITANTVMTSTLTSAGVTPGVNSGYGFWMTSNVGDAYFGGNTTIGNFLTVGSDAKIGGNLVVSGLITGGNLNANTVSTTTITQNAVTNQDALYDQTGGSVITLNPFVYLGTTLGYNVYRSQITLLPVNVSIPVGTGNVSTVLSGSIQGIGFVTANVSFSPTFSAVLTRTFGNGYTVGLSSTVTSTPAINLYSGGTSATTNQTNELIPPTVFVVGSSDTFVSSVPQKITYQWGIYLEVYTTTAASFSSANLTYYNQNLTVSSFKR